MTSMPWQSFSGAGASQQRVFCAQGQRPAGAGLLEYEILAKAVDLGPQAQAQAQAAVDDASRQKALEAGRANLSASLFERVVICGFQ